MSKEKYYMDDKDKIGTNDKWYKLLYICAGF